MAAQIAIEYGTRRVRLLEFDGSGRKVRVLGVRDASLDVPADLLVLEDVAQAEAEREGAEARPREGADPDDLRARAIAAAVSESDFVRDPSAMAFPAAHAMSREFDLPFTTREQIEKVVKFECESHFPGDIDDLVVQHFVLRQSRDKSHILAVGIRKDDLLDRLDILDEAGLDPMFVELDDFALWHALVGTGVAEECGERAVVVNAQETTTSLLFVQAGKLYALRSIRIGSAGAARAAEGEHATDIETARVHDVLGRLVREVRRTLGTLPEFGAPGKVLLTGTGSRLPGFAEALGQALGGPAEELDLLARVDHKLDDEEARRVGPDIGVALGIAFKLNGLDETHSDFRREEVAYTRKFDQVKTPLIVLSFLVFLLVAFLGLDKFLDARKVAREFDIMVAVGQEQLSGLLGDNEAAAAHVRVDDDGPTQMKSLLEATRSLREEIAQKLGRSRTIPDLPSALAVWIEFNKLLFAHEAAVGRIVLERCDIEVMGREPTLKIKGTVEDAAHYQTLLDMLKAHPMFADVEPGGTKQQQGGLHFEEITVRLNLAASAPVEG
jgi:Tfp pilus assembly PilM family ATPase